MKWYITLIGLLALVVTNLPAVAPQKAGAKKHKARTTQFQQPQPLPFTQTYTKFLQDSDFCTIAQQACPQFIWEMQNTRLFNELIFSWNAFRPSQGKLTFYASVRHTDKAGTQVWSPWHRFAEWAPRHQRSFINKKNRFVHTKHVRVEMQQGVMANAFRVKVVFEQHAEPSCLAALFACASDMRTFSVCTPHINRPAVLIQGVPRQSQMRIAHPRKQDLCSPTSASMLIQYFAKKLNGQRIAQRAMHDYVVDFASKVHDKGIDIYGNWLLNVAQAFDSSGGNVMFRVSRLNDFDELYNYLKDGIPVAVSVRSLPGGATPYRNGHFLVVIGWDSIRRTVVCIDPAFGKSQATLKSYPLGNFLRAWGRSCNLAYVPIPCVD